MYTAFPRARSGASAGPGAIKLRGDGYTAADAAAAPHFSLSAPLLPAPQKSQPSCVPAPRAAPPETRQGGRPQASPASFRALCLWAQGSPGPAIARPSAAHACRLLGVGTRRRAVGGRGACRARDSGVLSCSRFLVARRRGHAGVLGEAAEHAGPVVARLSAAWACRLLGVGDAGSAEDTAECSAASRACERHGARQGECSRAARRAGCAAESLGRFRNLGNWFSAPTSPRAPLGPGRTPVRDAPRSEVATSRYRSASGLGPCVRFSRPCAVYRSFAAALNVHRPDLGLLSLFLRPSQVIA